MPNYIIGPPLRSFPLNESYMFMKEKYVVLNYPLGEEKKDIINGPNRIIDGFPILANTIFENGIDCAFDIKHNKAFIFSGNQCAKIKYAPHSTDSRLLSGPIPIAAMFPCLEGTVFENGVDAAINFLEKHVHIFKGDETALLNHDTKDFCETSKFALNHLSCLFGTVFESGIDAAFASHIEHEAYIFKGDYYAHINIAGFGPRSDYIVGGRINRTSDDWPALHGMFQY